MAARSGFNISLTPQQQRFVRSRLSTGRYQTPSEVVREALHLLEFQERDREDAIKTLRKKLRRAAAQAERGELSDGEEFIDGLLARLAI